MALILDRFHLSTVKGAALGFTTVFNIARLSYGFIVYDRKQIAPPVV